jgi:peptidoglycan/LPS O-acetylase OafA/YrhL
MRVASGTAMAILIVLFEAVPVGSPLMVLLGYPVFGLVAAMFVASLAAAGDASAPARGWAGRAARRVGGSVVAFGRVSYFIYLFHLFVLELLLYLQRRSPQPVLGFWQALAIATVVVFALALLSWKVFEQPLIRYGRRVAQSLLARPAFGLGARHESRAGNER